jgi:hypothetical protein
MDWLFELEGEASDKLALRPLAPACNCSVSPGPDARPWLGGARFADKTSSDQVLDDATRTLLRLNGLARLKNPDHRLVSLGNAYLQDRQFRYINPALRPIVVGSEVYEYTSPLTGGAPPVPHDPVGDSRRAHITAEPRLAEIIEVFADDITWQRLRVAFEKINALVGKGDNSLVKNGYATKAELTDFKANVEDPRHSGVKAVHGVPKGPAKGTKMTEKEGFGFVTRLFNTYVDKHLSRSVPHA